MARLIQKPAFADSDGVTKTLHYTVADITSEDVARNYFLSQTSSVIATSWGTLYRDRPVLRQTAYNQFDVDVTYGLRPKTPGEYTFEFDTTGGTVTITRSKESIKRYKTGASELGAAAATAIPKHDNAINVDRTGEPKGTEIVIPALKFSVQFNHAMAVVTPAFMKSLHNLTGLVNSTTFFTFAAGEVLFLGARGSDGSSAEASVNYSFAASPNALGLTIGDIAGIDKKGWEYLWITFNDKLSAGDKAVKPLYVYVERMYDVTDLASNLGFG